MATIKREDNGNTGRWVVYENENEAGEMTFKWKDKIMIIIDHTSVDEKYSGKGFGKQLVMKAVEFAREKNIKIKPECSYAKKIMDKDESTNDIRA